MKLFQNKDLTPNWQDDVQPPTNSAQLHDPPFPGRAERAIAAPQKRSENEKKVSLDSKLAAPSVRLHRNQL